ncbi:MAG: hypothetical protein IT385_13600 [Deltaproteobacteria bacterium]|nr:hypothetical protein [Deltaproteobacteria bacterium]
MCVKARALATLALALGACRGSDEPEPAADRAMTSGAPSAEFARDGASRKEAPEGREEAYHEVRRTTDRGTDAADGAGPREFHPPGQPGFARPSGEFFRELPAGVVSAELVGRCRALPEASGVIERARACGTTPDGATCEDDVPLGVVGFDEEGQAAIVSAPWFEPCGADPHYRVFAARPPSLRSDDVTTYEPSKDAVSKTLAWVAARARRLTPVDNLIELACELEAWTTPHERLAVLREPLAGWMMTIARGRRALPVRLVAPGNKQVHELGFIDVGPGVCDTEEDGRDAPCEREVSASVSQLVLSPSRRTLVLTARVAPHERCAPERVVHVSFRLPDAVRSVMTRPSTHGIRRRDVPPRRRTE